MGSLIMAIFLIAFGFVAGWRYGYKQVYGDVQHVVNEVLSSGRHRPRE